MCFGGTLVTLAVACLLTLVMSGYSFRTDPSFLTQLECSFQLSANTGHY